MVRGDDMKSKSSLVVFLIAAIAALALHFFLFEMRYMWYPPIEVFRIWRMGYIVCIAVIFALWAFFPSRVMVAIVGLVAIFFPHLYPSGVVDQMGRQLDLPSLGLALLSVLFLVGATELRRRSQRESPRVS